VLAAEMKIFVPVIEYEPSPFGSALVRRMPRSVPQCGSVRHIVPVHSPDTSFGRYCCCSSGAVRVQAFVGAVRQAGIHRPGLVRRVQHFVERVVDERGQALAAVFRVAAERGPAGLDVLAVGFLEAGRRLHDAVAFIGTAFAIADLVQREQHLGAELARFLQHLVDRVGVEVRMPRHCLTSASTFRSSCSTNMSRSGAVYCPMTLSKGGQNGSSSWRRFPRR
jgi:hypothetical protein